jgi:hypothetical protein
MGYHCLPLSTIDWHAKEYLGTSGNFTIGNLSTYRVPLVPKYPMLKKILLALTIWRFRGCTLPTFESTRRSKKNYVNYLVKIKLLLTAWQNRFYVFLFCLETFRGKKCILDWPKNCTQDWSQNIVWCDDVSIKHF